jgi:hypothetical protein
MKKIIAYAVLMTAVLSGAPVYAETGVGSDKALSIIQFSELPQNHGVPSKLLNKKYEDYRRGRVAVTTLSASNIR